MPGDGAAIPPPESLLSRWVPAGMTGRGFRAERTASTTFCGSVREKQQDDCTRAFVPVAQDSPWVLDYCALNAHAVATKGLGADQPRRAPSTGTVPALHLSTMAIDRSWQGKGYGADLAVDALNRVRNVSSEMGIKLVVLDEIYDGGDEALTRRMKFCRRIGIQGLKDRPYRMFMTSGRLRIWRSCGWGDRRRASGASGRSAPATSLRPELPLPTSAMESSPGR